MRLKLSACLPVTTYPFILQNVKVIYHMTLSIQVFLCRIQENFPDSEMAEFAAYCQTSLERTKQRFVGNSWNVGLNIV